MSFRTMGEFRSALRNLARSNMSMTVRTPEGGEITFDTVDELVAYQEAMGRSAPKRGRRGRRKTAGSLGAPRTQKGRKKRKKSTRTSVPSDRAHMHPTNKQAGAIIASAGGFGAVCPWVMSEEGYIPAGQILYDLGLTRGTASAVIKELKAAGVYKKNDPQSKAAAEARSILTAAGAHCAVANPVASGMAWPEYSYQQFWRKNPRARRNGQRYNTAWWPEPSANPPEFIPMPAPDNAGPFLPDIFPYGQGGVAGRIAQRNPKATLERRKKAARRGLTLSGGIEWPVYDREHALLSLQYMAFGAGGAKWQKKYPQMVRRLAEIYSPEDARNRDIWTYYRKVRSKIAGVSGKTMPTMRALRAVEPRRAAANPKKHRKARRKRR